MELIPFMDNENIKSIELLRKIIIAFEDNQRERIIPLINEASNYINDYFVELNNKSDDAL